MNTSNHESILQGETPFFFAAKREDLKVMKMLQKAGADLNYIDYHGNSPNGNTVLHVMLRKRYSNITKLNTIVEYILTEYNIGKVNIHRGAATRGRRFVVHVLTLLSPS